MSVHEYFNRNHESWSILDFLNECKLEPFDQKIDCYIKSLKSIAELDHGNRQECGVCGGSSALARGNSTPPIICRKI
jgi:hypothetical protein